MSVPESPTKLGLTKFPDWRQGQKEILEKLLNSNRFTLLEAPTGSGKTLISTSLHKLLKLRGTVYCPTTKKLQDQYINDFKDFAVDLKGRANYLCLQPGIKSASNCIETKEEPCEFRESCEYKLQVEKARLAELACVNIWSLLCQTQFAGRFTRKSSRLDEPKRELLILDEADALENVLTNFSSRSITQRTVNKYYLPYPDFTNKDISYWLKWLERAVLAINEAISKAPTKEEKNELLSFKLNTLTSLREDINDTWVVELGTGSAHLTPTDISSLAHRYLFNHFDNILLMSATLGPAYPKIVGIEEYNYLQLPSYFPAYKRPVYYIPVGNLTSKLEEVELPRVAEVIDKILNLFKEQAIIHTISDKRAERLQTLCKSEIVTHNSANGVALDLFTDKLYKAIASPSLVRGYDFPDDTCRINIIAKIPYPSLGSESVRAKLNKSQEWYNWQAVRDIIQMTGRSTRSPNDYSLTFILDSQLEKLLARARYLFSGWWLEALHKVSKVNYNMLVEASK